MTKGWALLIGLVLSGCGRTVTEDDCVKIKDNMHAAWAAESDKAIAEARKGDPEAPGPEKAAAVIKAEGEKLTIDWMAECKQELMGRRVEPKEMDCLLKATSIAQINKCSAP